MMSSVSEQRTAVPKLLTMGQAAKFKAKKIDFSQLCNSFNLKEEYKIE